MRISFDPDRGDLRLDVDKTDANDCWAFTGRIGDDALAADFARRLIALANSHTPPVTMQNRRSFALALCRMIAFLYGEDITDDPAAPTLARMTMNRAQSMLDRLPVADPRLPDRDEPPNSHDKTQTGALLSNLFGQQRIRPTREGSREHRPDPGPFGGQDLRGNTGTSLRDLFRRMDP